MANKAELYDRLKELGVDETTTIALCNFFSSSGLEEFVEFYEEEQNGHN